MTAIYTLLPLGACNSSPPPSTSGVAWNENVPGVWNVSVGTPEKVNLLSELNVTPKLDAIRKMGEASLPISKEDITFEVVDGKTYLRFPLEKDKKIFGLGLNFKTVEQRGRIMRLHVDHYTGKDDGETFDYEKGAYSRISLQVTVDANGQKAGKAVLPEGGKVWSYTDFNFRFMTK